MARVRKQAGRFTVETWTEGWPLWIKIEDIAHGTELRLLDPEDARDLHYALGRVLAQIDPLVTGRKP